MIETFLLNHPLFAGSAGFLMIAILPGLIFYRLLDQELGWLAWPTILAVSLVANFQLVFYLTLVGAFRMEVLATVGQLGLVGLVALSFMRIGRERRSGNRISGAKLEQASAPSPVAAALAWAATGLAVATAYMLIVRLAAAVPGVFDAWDAVVSWNRWAVDWSRGGFPRNTYGYPQLIPTAWATTYLWLGSVRIDFVAKGLMALFPLAVMAVFVDLYVRTRWPAALYALALWPLLLLRVFPEIIDSGYVDIPVALFVLLTAYLLFLGNAGWLPHGRAWWLAAIFAAGAALTKQAGWLAVIMLLAATALRYRQDDQVSRQDVRRAISTVTLLAGPALAYQFYGLWAGTDPGNFSYVTSTIYAGETLPDRLWRAVSVNTVQAIEALVPGPGGVIALFVLLTGALRVREGRLCWLGIVLPYYLAWALLFSYDLRNFMPVVPIVCLGLGFGIHGLFLWRAGPHRLSESAKPGLVVPVRTGQRVLVPMAVLVLLLGSLLPRVTTDDLVRLSESHRLQSGDPEINRALLEFSRKSGFAGKILTSHAPVATIDGVREYFFSTPERPWLSLELVLAMKEGRPICHIISLLPRHEELRYLVLHAGMWRRTTDQALAAGELRLLAESAQFRFMEIVCPRITATTPNE